MTRIQRNKGLLFNATSTIEHPERRHWHTGDTDMDESDPDKSEREHPDDTDVDESDPDKSEREHSDDTDVEGTDLSKTEKEEQDDTDVKESDSGNKDPYEDEDSDNHITIILRNDHQNHLRRIIPHTPAEIDLIEM